MAGGLPILLLLCIGAAQSWRRRQLVETVCSKSALPISEESAEVEPRERLPYYRLNETEEVLPVAERPDGIFSRIGFWVADYFITHFALVSVLGAVAVGGIAVTSTLSRIKFVNVWTVLAGIALFLVYLVFVGVVIVAVNNMSEKVLRWFIRRKE